MKTLLTAVGLLAFAGCSPLPRTDIHVVDGNGAPISGFPLRLKFSDGLYGHSLPRPFDSVPHKDVSQLELFTNGEGRASVEYNFTEKQPSDWRSAFLGAERVPNQWIEIIPMRNLPKGSKITLGIPNP